MTSMDVADIRALPISDNLNVHACGQRLMSTEVAIKFIKAAAVRNEYALRNLDREARILSSICHPSIVFAYEAIKHRSYYCLVMELVSGNELSEFIRERPGGKLDERTTNTLVRQIASALEHIHDRGIVHRDLKLQNIMVDEKSGLIKIIDFGLSNSWSPMEPLSTNCGSPEYAAPELFNIGRKYGPEVDMWSLGIITFVMAAGSLPFYLSRNEQRSLSFNRQRQLLVSRIQKGILPKHMNLITHYSKDFRHFVAGLLNTNPIERFSVRDALSHIWTTKGHRAPLEWPNPSKSNYDFRKKLILKLSRIMNIKPENVQRQLINEPLGSIGGMHRILHHHELRKFWRSFEMYSPLDLLSGSSSSGNLRTCYKKSIPQKLKDRGNFQQALERNADGRFPNDNSVPSRLHLKSQESLNGKNQNRAFNVLEKGWCDFTDSEFLNDNKNLLLRISKAGNWFHNWRIHSSQNSDVTDTKIASTCSQLVYRSVYSIHSSTSRTTCPTSRSDLSDVKFQHLVNANKTNRGRITVYPKLCDRKYP